MPKDSRNAQFLVTLTIPPGVTQGEIITYIKTEIQGNVGRFSPADPLFHLDRNSVKVKRFYTKEQSTPILK